MDSFKDLRRFEEYSRYGPRGEFKVLWAFYNLVCCCALNPILIAVVAQATYLLCRGLACRKSAHHYDMRVFLGERARPCVPRGTCLTQGFPFDVQLRLVRHPRFILQL